MIEDFFMQNSVVFARLGVAVGLGLLIGLERALINKDAGMKTHALVSMGAALFVLISEVLATKYAGISNFDPSRIASQIIVGVGFLGAGSIMLQGSRLSGLTTAGGLWVTAGIGMAAGLGLLGLATISTVFVVFILVVVYVIEKQVKKFSRPTDNQQ